MAGEHILIVRRRAGDPERRCRGVLEDEGYRVTAVGSGAEALAAARTTRRPTSSSSTSGCRAWTAWRPLAEIKRLRPESAVVMISGHGTIETAVKATKLGAYDFIEKPLSLEKTLLAAVRALEHSRLERENRALREQLERGQEIVGKSALIERAAAADRGGRAHQRPRAHPGRERRRQGAGGPRASTPVRAARGPLRRGRTAPPSPRS